MRITICSLKKENLAPLEQHIPEYYMDNVGEEGYYTLGAVCFPDGVPTLIGMSQFYVDSAPDGLMYSELNYVYVLKEYRGQSLGTRLVGMADSILTDDVDVFMAGVVPGAMGRSAKELSGEAKRSFLKECGFIPIGNDHRKFFRFTGR